MNRRYLWLALPLAAFGFSGLGLYFYFITPGEGGPFKDNLVPELIGFCLEGFFLVGLFTFIQQMREHDRRQELWLSLRGSLREFLSHLDIAFLSADAEPTPSTDLETKPQVVDRLMRAMKETEIDLDSMVSLKKVGVANLALAHDLIPVAAQLSAGHMRWWIAIVDSMKRLSEARDRSQVEQSVYTLLLNLREFDAIKI
ncbi:MAG: hypothetical protein R3200_17400 [Xanthomonadales bacterium]|nr:hypothetical protein [Xanthomonadales bacterium]